MDPRTRWSRPRLPSSFLIDVLEILVVGAAYYVAARLSLRLALIEHNVTPLWPPTGIAIVAFLVRGRRVWPGVALAAFLVNLPISTWAVPAAATAAGNTVAPLVGAELLGRFGFRKEIDRLRDALAIVLLGALGSMLISATIGATTLVLSGAVSGSDFVPAWAVWWTGDAMGVLVVAPFLLSVWMFLRKPRWSWAQWAEAVTLFVALTVLSLAVTRSELGLLFLMLPLLGLGAWRLQQRGAAPAALLVSGIATWAAAHGWAPFDQSGLFETMLKLQAFNATVAFTSFFFAAMVSERIRTREALEQAAADLEDRVHQRTSELSTANAQLRRQIAERREAERMLRQSERQLAEAQQVARVGSWEWMVQENLVSWSEEMYRIYGYTPQEVALTFERAMELIVPEDLERISANVTAALAGAKDHILPPMEYRIVRPDGVERTLLGKARLTVGPSGTPHRMVGTVQDITEDKRAEREHRIAETLQRSLLPERLPEIPGVLLAARYVPAGVEAQVGGDWYDVVPLPNGNVGIAIGDVAGHGLRAASTMGQVRMALRAYALEEQSPALVVQRVHRLVKRLLLPDMATLVYLVFDPDSATLRFANAGHPPPLVLTGTGEATFLEEGLAPPLGTAPHPDHFVEGVTRLDPGATLVLFTDGLVERRGVSLRHGLDRLRAEVVAGGPDLDELCDHLIETLPAEEVWDDIALLAVRPLAVAGEPLRLHVPAEPQILAPLRHAMRRWLRAAGASPDEVFEILVASGEACSNAIQHPYGAAEGFLDLDLFFLPLEGTVEITVRDAGRWRPAADQEGGRGLRLMRDLMDAVEVRKRSRGTEVRMRRRLSTLGSG